MISFLKPALGGGGGIISEGLRHGACDAPGLLEPSLLLFLFLD